MRRFSVDSQFRHNGGIGMKYSQNAGKFVTISTVWNFEALVLGIKSRFSDMARAIRAFSKFQVLMSASAL